MSSQNGFPRQPSAPLQGGGQGGCIAAEISHAKQPACPSRIRADLPPLQGGARGGASRRPPSSQNRRATDNAESAHHEVRAISPAFHQLIPGSRPARKCWPSARSRSPRITELYLATAAYPRTHNRTHRTRSPVKRTRPPDDSPMVKLLKSKRVPEDRQGTIVELIGKRGTADDLAFIYEQAITAGRIRPASVRVKALEALAAAAANRNLKPPADLEKLLPLVQRATSRIGRSVTRKSRDTFGRHLEARAGSEGTRRDRPIAKASTNPCRAEAFDALATIGGKAGSAPIEALAGENSPEATRLLAIAALAKLDLKGAATRAAEFLSRPPQPGRNLVPLLQAFLDRQGGLGNAGEGDRRSHHPGRFSQARLEGRLRSGPIRPGAGRSTFSSRRHRRAQQAALADRAQQYGLRSRRQGRPGPRRGGLPPHRLELHELPLRFQGRRRRRARI